MSESERNGASANHPDLEIVKPSDTKWFSHEKCVPTVKKCYGVILCALDSAPEIVSQRH